MLPDITPIGTVLVYILTYFGLMFGFYLLFVLVENKEILKAKKIKDFPKTTIIVPMYNSAKSIVKCLESLVKLDYPTDKLEIIVVDDGSNDGSIDRIKKFKVRLYKRPHMGKAYAVNYGIEKATGQLIGILDADSFVEHDALKKMIGYFESKEDIVGAVHSGIRVKNPNKLIEKFQETEYALTLFFKKLFSFVGGLFVTPGVFSIYNAKVLKNVGKFDEGNITEDLEIGLKLLSKGYKIKCAIEAKTYTEVPKTFKELKRQRIRWNIGLVKNFKEYSFLFSKNYGELGYFILPMSLISPIFLLILFSYLLLNLTFEIVNQLVVLSITGPYTYIMSLLDFELSLGFLQSSLVIYTIIIFSVGFVFLYYSKKYTLFSKNDFSVISKYLVYTLLSGYIYFYFWVLALYKFLRGDIKW